jgi:hypothetical protein
LSSVTKLSSQRISGPRSAITAFELAAPSRSCSMLASPSPGVSRSMTYFGIWPIHTDPAVERIVLLDARAVLSPDAWRRVDGQWGAVMFRGAFRRAINRGVFVPLPLKPLAMIVTGALAEACLLVADAEDPEAAREEALAVVVRLLEGIRAQR